MFRRRESMVNKNVLVGGGSQGLGLALACLLARRGANITIVSRSRAKLTAALVQVEGNRTRPEQKLESIAADLSSADGADKAFNEYSAINGIPCPEYVFACSGGAGSILGMFQDLSAEQLSQGWQVNYETVLWTTHAAAKRMIANNIRGKIVLTSSVVGLFSFAGYSAYAPAKHAIRGLADTLRSEFLMYGIRIHCYFPGTIHSPGYEEEEKCKPAITKKIEGPDDGKTPEQCAQALINGVERGNFLITSDTIGHIFRNAARGASPLSNAFIDPLWQIIAAIALPIWRMFADADVRKFAKRA